MLAEDVLIQVIAVRQLIEMPRRQIGNGSFFLWIWRKLFVERVENLRL